MTRGWNPRVCFSSSQSSCYRLFYCKVGLRFSKKLQLVSSSCFNGFLKTVGASGSHVGRTCSRTNSTNFRLWRIPWWIQTFHIHSCQRRGGKKKTTNAIAPVLFFSLKASCEHLCSRFHFDAIEQNYYTVGEVTGEVDLFLVINSANQNQEMIGIAHVESEGIDPDIVSCVCLFFSHFSVTNDSPQAWGLLCVRFCPLRVPECL